MHLGDYTFILLLALVLFGPRKLPEIGRTVGKLLAEFRRASNEFKFQIQEELRNMEEEERRKKLAESKALAAASTQAMVDANVTPAAETGPVIMPPSTGAPVGAARPFAAPEEALPETGEAPEPVAVQPSTPAEADLPATSSPETLDPAVPVHPAESVTHG